MKGEYKDTKGNRNKLVLIEFDIDVAIPSPGRQRVMTACVPSDEILAAAAAGPGTTLGAPQ